MRTPSLKALALFLCLICLPALPGVCAGAREAQLSDVMRFIDAKDYPSALKLLATIQRDHPEQRDETQRLIVQIISSQGREYNIALGQLIHALYEEQDEKKALQIIDTLRKLDPGRSLVDAQNSITYLKFLKLMDNASALLSQRKAAQAIDLYLLPITDPARAGVDLGKPAFDAAGYGNLVTASVQDAVARVVDQASRAKNDATALKGPQAALDALLASPGSAQNVDRLNDVLAPLTGVAEREKSIGAASSALSDLRRSAGKNDVYLQYLVWLCNGRANKPPEGIAQAIRTLWQTQAAGMADAAYAAAQAAYSSGARLYDRGDFTSADPKLNDAYFRGMMAVKIVSFEGAAVHPQADWGFLKQDSALVTSLLEKARQSQELTAQAFSLRQLISFQRQYQTLPAIGTDPQALAGARVQAQALLDSALQAREEWTRRATELGTQQALGLSLQPQIDSSQEMSARFVTFASLLEDKDLAYALALARMDSGQFAGLFSQAVKNRLDGQDRMNGTVNGKPPAADVFVERRPADALKLYGQASSTLDGIDSDIASLRARWQADRGYVTSSGALKTLLAGLDATESKVAVEQSELSRLTQLAQQQHEQAVAKRKEGDLAFADGNRALTAKQFDNAKLQLGDARDLYLDSLLLEEDDGIRRRYTVEIPALFNRINLTIKQQYIAEVDAQVNNGRSLFAGGEFLKAFLTLETAQVRWKATLGDTPNTDLDNLLEKVRNALRVSGGRDLSPEDSRAPTVNGFLKLANDKVTLADKLPKSDPQRKQILDEASANVSSALDVAPVYRAAKALQLRIRKLEAKDDSAFRAEAKSEIDSILDEYRSKKGQPDRLYFALKDYQDILPDYQPLKDAIQELEITLGFRIRPPSAAEIARASDALARAQGVYDPGNPLTFDPALSELDTAIRLNPSNARAVALRRTILLKEGSPEASALSSAGLARFAESKRLYNTEDYAGAYKILQDLMVSDKRNASYPPLAQLYLLTQQKLGLR